jgi:hypothetical protein
VKRALKARENEMTNINAGRPLLEAKGDEMDEMVMCTGCGIALPEAEATYSDHADTYSGTVWHCSLCWQHCGSPAALRGADD